jgi:hypothetical protein
VPVGIRLYFQSRAHGYVDPPVRSFSKRLLSVIRRSVRIDCIQRCQVRVEKDSLATNFQNEVIDSFSFNRAVRARAGVCRCPAETEGNRLTC